jgi:hypothetical protein
MMDARSWRSLLVATRFPPRSRNRSAAVAAADLVQIRFVNSAVFAVGFFCSIPAYGSDRGTPFVRAGNKGERR